MPDGSVQPDAFIKICPSRQIVARLSDKWSMLILALLKDSPLRFGEIKRQVEGISQKMLTQTLRNLERDGLIIRTVYNEMPLRVEYQVTSLTAQLIPLVMQIKRWAEDHMHEILEANVRYEKRMQEEE